jgi:hypothetical protein
MEDEKPASAGGVDVRSEACPTCGQVNVGQTGEHPCAACGLPTLHDPESDDELPSLEEARRELRAEGIDPDELGRRMRERVESMLREVTPDVCAEVPLSVGDLVITDDGTHGVIVCVQPLTACWDLHTAPPSPHAPRGGFTPRRWSVIPCPRGYTPKRREAAPQRPVTERVSDILDAMPDHWQASWHALLDLLPICAEGDDLAVTDKAAAIAHFSAVRDTIAARLPGLRDDGEDLAGLIVDCDRSIADLSRVTP